MQCFTLVILKEGQAMLLTMGYCYCQPRCQPRATISPIWPLVTVKYHSPWSFDKDILSERWEMLPASSEFPFGVSLWIGWVLLTPPSVLTFWKDVKTQTLYQKLLRDEHILVSYFSQCNRNKLQLWFQIC